MTTASIVADAEFIKRHPRAHFGETELMKAIQSLIRGEKAPEEVVDVIITRPSSVNLQDADGRTALHFCCSAVAMSGSGQGQNSSHFRGREDVIGALLEAGANAYLVDNEGRTAIDCAVTDMDREEIIAILLKYRLKDENNVPSVAPLFASRLMKRDMEDKGFGVFSNVARHCMYYLYKGAVYLWDTIDDVEHVIYQPRHSLPDIAKTQSKLENHWRKRSFVAHGGIDTTYDVNDEELLSKRIQKLESALQLVRHFAVGSGLDATKEPLPMGGVTEWVLCDTGVLISIQLTRKGIVMAPGQVSALSRRKSHVCGAAATYPQGMVPKIDVKQNCCIRFARLAVAGNVCCAMDGLRGNIGYVLSLTAPKPLSTNTGLGLHRVASNLPQKFKAFGETTSGTTTPRGLSTEKKSVQFEVHGGQDWNLSVSAAENNDNTSSCGESPPTGENDTSPEVPLYSHTGDTIFRIVQMVDMTPKTGLNDAMIDFLCYTPMPFSGCEVFDHELQDSVPLSVQLLGKTDLVVFTSNGPTIALAEGGVRFFAVETNPDGQICYGAATDPERFRRIRSPSTMAYLVQVSSVVEIFEYTVQHQVTPIARVSCGRYTPEKFFPLFHPTEDALILLYQCNKRQELCKYNINSQRMSSVCRLPKPSSVRFYQPGTDDAKTLPELHFHFSFDGKCLLRYNVSMHVMSIYSWEELEEQGSAGQIGYVNAVFIRNPIPIKKNHPREQQALVEAEKKRREQLKAGKQAGTPCVWLTVQSQELEELAKGSITSRSGGSAVVTFADDEDVHREEMIDESTGQVTLNFPMEVCQDVKHKKIAAEGFATLESFFASVVKAFGGKVVAVERRKRHATGWDTTEEMDIDEIEEELEESDKGLVSYASRSNVSGTTSNRGRRKGEEQIRTCTACFSVPLDAARCAMKLLRSSMDSAPWSESVLQHKNFVPEKLQYRCKSQLEKKFPSEYPSEDSEATEYNRRGPLVRVTLSPGDSKSYALELHESICKVITPKTDGVVAVEGKLMRSMQPLVSFLAATPVATAKVGSTTLIVPRELDFRLI